MNTSTFLAQVEGRLRHPDVGMASIVIFEVRDRQLTAVVSAPDLPERVRCAFVHHGPPAGRVELLASVSESRSDGKETGAVLRALALYSSAGRGVIEGFLRDAFGHPTYSDEHFAPRGKGIYFAFNPRRLQKLAAKGTARRPSQPRLPQGPILERRWQSRVEVDLPVRAQTQSGAETVRLIEVSRYGARLEAADEIQPIDGKVRLHLKIAAGVLVVPVVADCTVRWTQSQDGSHPCVAGLRLDRVKDGASGRRWEQWLKALSATGDVRPAFARGSEVPRTALRPTRWRQG